MRIVPVLLALLSLGACSLLPDHSLDYLQAKNVPPLVVPTAEGRNIKPLYVIPEIATPEQTVVLVQGEGRKQRFVAPSPKPLVVTGKSSAADPKPTVLASKPQIVNDGLSIIGGYYQFGDHWIIVNRNFRALLYSRIKSNSLTSRIF